LRRGVVERPAPWGWFVRSAPASLARALGALCGCSGGSGGGVVAVTEDATNDTIAVGAYDLHLDVKR
jgi:hypothetical protein